MLKIWGKLWVRDKVVKSYTVENIQRTGSLEDCVKSALPKIIEEFDLPMPIFLCELCKKVTLNVIVG